VLKIKPPTTADQPKLAPDIAGYIQPDLETWREQRTELEWLKQLMYFALWNTTVDKAENETATAAFIDVQPVNDRLNKFADAYEQTEKFIIDIVSYFHVRDNYEGASVNYGRRFIIEPPDKIWQKYQNARATGANKITLSYLLIQFYQAEYQNDLKQLAIVQKSIKHEPFIHKTDEEIMSLDISRMDKLKKFYFSEFWKRLTDDEIIMSSDEQIEKMFNDFMKLVEPEEKETPEQPEQNNNDLNTEENEG
jgi:hypothetical protein